MNKYTHIAIQVCIAVAILAALDAVSGILNEALSGWQREWSVDILSGSAMVGWLYTSTSLSMLVDKLRREEEGL